MTTSTATPKPRVRTFSEALTQQLEAELGPSPSRGERLALQYKFGLEPYPAHSVRNRAVS